MTLLGLLDHAAVLIFALTGALAASRAQLDLIGFAFVANLTAVGGGTLRDLLLDRNPVFWMAAPSYLATATVAALLVFFTAHLVESRLKWLTWLDSFALATAVTAGTGVALAADQSAPVTVILGIVTGTAGGLLRDITLREVPLVLKQGELYVSAAFAGTCAALVALHLDAPTPAALLACATVTWVFRAGSLAFGWRLPVYRARPPST